VATQDLRGAGNHGRRRDARGPEAKSWLLPRWVGRATAWSSREHRAHR